MNDPRKVPAADVRLYIRCAGRLMAVITRGTPGLLIGWRYGRGAELGPRDTEVQVWPGEWVYRRRGDDGRLTTDGATLDPIWLSCHRSAHGWHGLDERDLRDALEDMPLRPGSRPPSVAPASGGALAPGGQSYWSRRVEP